MKFYYKLTNQPENYQLMDKLGNEGTPLITEVIDKIKQNGGYSSLTHPIKSFYRYIGDDKLDMLRKTGVDGIEAYHQYSPSKITKLGKCVSQDPDEAYQKITNRYIDYARNNSMFISGGTDSHETHIFADFLKIDKNLFDKIMGN